MQPDSLARRALARYMRGRGGEATINRLLQANPNFLKGVHPPKPPAPVDGIGTPPVAHTVVSGVLPSAPTLQQQKQQLAYDQQLAENNAGRGVYDGRGPRGAPTNLIQDVHRATTPQAHRGDLQAAATIRAIQAVRAGQPIGAATQARLRSTSPQGTRRAPGWDLASIIGAVGDPDRHAMLMDALRRRRARRGMKL